jgi:hypothetical protein
VRTIVAIAQTDSILRVPRRLAQMTATMLGIPVVEPPREINAFPTSWYDISGSPLSPHMNGSVNYCGLLLGQLVQFPAQHRSHWAGKMDLIWMGMTKK